MERSAPGVKTLVRTLELVPASINQRRPDVYRKFASSADANVPFTDNDRPFKLQGRSTVWDKFESRKEILTVGLDCFIDMTEAGRFLFYSRILF